MQSQPFRRKQGHRQKTLIVGADIILFKCHQIQPGLKVLFALDVRRIIPAVLGLMLDILQGLFSRDHVWLSAFKFCAIRPNHAEKRSFRPRRLGHRLVLVTLPRILRRQYHGLPKRIARILFVTVVDARHHPITAVAGFVAPHQHIIASESRRSQAPGYIVTSPTPGDSKQHILSQII